MPSSRPPEIVVTGVGVVSAIGQGKAAFTAALLAGDTRFGVMARPGRQRDSRFLGAELPGLSRPPVVDERVWQPASLSARAALVALAEAWADAGLEDCDRNRLGLIVGGSNVQQRETVLVHERHAARPQFMRPTYGLSFMDTDLCGFCTAAFGIRGPAWTVGGASASGQLAVIEAAQAVASGRVDRCIAIGALMDLSYWECQALRSLGAMGSTRFADAPAEACRPFDEQRDGFIFGESCAALVIERAGTRAALPRQPYARLAGWSMVMDANRNPDPSVDGEVAAIRQALDQAGMAASDIGYVNPHGSGSTVGDVVELQALATCGLRHARINATKSVTGHGLSAAGAVEVAATAVQFEAGALHPSVNLGQPVDAGFEWVSGKTSAAQVGAALNLSFGFGGINTALVMERLI